MEEQKKPKKSIFRQRRWQAGCAIILLFLAYTLSGFYLLPWVLKTQEEKRLPAVLLRPVTCKQIKFNPFTLRLQVDGFTVKGVGAEKNLLKINSLLLDIAGFTSLINRALVLKQVDIQRPYFDVVKNRDLSYNFSDILKALTAPSPEAAAETAASENSGFRFSLNNITLAGGLVEFADNSTDTVHKVTDIAISLPWISNFPKLIENDVEPSFAAVINGTQFSAKGTSKPFNHTLETHFAINLDKLDLPYYLSYLPGERNFNLAAGTLTTHLDLVYVQPQASKPRLTLKGTVTINDFLVSGKNKEKDYRFISFPELVISLGSGNLLAGEIFLDELVCRKPEIDFLHKPDGVFYLPMLIAAASAKKQNLSSAAGNKTANQTQSDPAIKLIFKLAKMRLEEGIVRIYDKRVTPAFSTRFSPVNLTVENISTVAGAPAQYDLKLKSDFGEALSCTGDFSLDPLRVNTHFALQGLPLPEYVAYYKDYFAGRFSGGQLGLEGDVAFTRTEAGEMRMNLDDFSCALADCKLSTPDGQTVLDLPRCAVSQSEIDFNKHECVIGSVTGKEGRINLVRRKDGVFNFAELLPAAVAIPNSKADKPISGKEADANAGALSAAAQNSEKPWHLLLAQGRLQNFSVNFKDLVPAAATLMQADKINLNLEKLGTGRDETGTFKLGLQLARKGKLIVAGAVGLDPLQAELDINLKKLPLPVFQNYLAEALDLALVRGDFTTQSKLSFQTTAAGENKLGFTGDLAFDNLQAVAADRSGELLSWRHLGLEKIAYNSQPPTISLKRILGDGLKINLVKGRDGRTNFEKIVPQKGVTPTATTGSLKKPVPEKNQALLLDIKELEFANSSLDFVDHSLLPSVAISLDDFAGSVTGISSTGKKPAAVALTGKLNNQALISVSGRVNPFPKELLVDLQIKGDGVGLTSVSPYSGKYVGYGVNKGKVSFDLNYQVKDHKLVAKNNIFIDQFDFGATVDSPDAMHLPVKMAVALLRNRQGEIDLNLPVSGDLNDPKFSVGGVIVKVFINLITKAVSSPFSLIGSLAGGGGADLNLVNFAPGRAGLDAEPQARLQKLAKVLYDRPGLNVEIVGHALTPGDREALQDAHFIRLLKQQKMKAASRKKGAQDVADIVIKKEEFKDYLWLAYKAAPIKKEKVLLGLVKKIDPVEQERLLRDYVKVHDDELSALATRRARTVMDFLIEKGPVAAKRLFLTAPQIVKSGSGNDTEKGTQVEIKIK